MNTERRSLVRRTTMVLASAALALCAAAPNRAQDGGVGYVVYTANATGFSVSVLDGDTMQQIRGDLAPTQGSRAIALAPDGSRVYTSGLDSLSVFDAVTGANLDDQTFTEADEQADCVASHDGARVFTVAASQASVFVYGVTSMDEEDEFPLPSVGSNTPNPNAIDIAPDDGALFVLSGDDFALLKLSAADGSLLDSAIVAADSREVRVSADGATVVVVGAARPQFFRTSDLELVQGADVFDRGTGEDVAAAGARFYVLNQDLLDFGAPAKPLGGPKGALPSLGPSIDVYTAATGAFVESIQLSISDTVHGIAVTKDGARAFVTRTGGENSGSVTSVDLATKAVLLTGPTGSFPRRVAVKETGEETPVNSYFLPRSVNVKLPGAGKDFVGASGFYDVGDAANVDYAQPVTIEIGSFTRTFTLLPKGAGFKSPKDPVVTFAIVPNLKGSSRGKFKLKVAKTTLGGQIDPSQPVAFHFRGTGLADAAGTLSLTAGRYRLGKARGALVAPFFFPQKAKAKVGGDNADSFGFVGGFATNGQTPAQLGTVRFAFGGVFSRTIPGAQFTKKGDVFTFSAKQGAASFKIVVDFLRETVAVSGKKVELGDLAGPTTDVVFDAGAGAGTFRNTVRLGSSGATRGY